MFSGLPISCRVSAALWLALAIAALSYFLK